MGKYFGTDGFRGRVNASLTAEHAYEIGRCLGHYIMERGEYRRIVMGKDPRRSSYLIESSIVAGFLSVGVDVYTLHVTTTASISYILSIATFDFGVMISASHNPYTDNGIKIFSGEGDKIGEEIEEMIERHLDRVASGEKIAFSHPNVGEKVDFIEGREGYLSHLISLSSRPLFGKRIGLDCSNGSTYAIAPRVFQSLGAKVSVLGNQPNGGNINVGCGSTHPQALVQLVKEKQLDVGFAFDGDGDRCICVDEQGNIIDGDGILYALRRHGKGQIALTVMSNLGTVQSLQKEGIRCHITGVGDRFVWEEMKRTGAMLGGENAGHIIFADSSKTGDGIITALRFLEEMGDSPASSLVSGLVRLAHVEDSLPVLHKREILQNPDFIKEVEGSSNRIEEMGGRLLVRPSGTEEKIRFLAEGGEESRLKEEILRLKIKTAEVDQKLP